MGISVMGSRVLEVKGRKSGEWRSTPVNLLTVEGSRYLVAPRGHTQWVRNMRVSGGGRLKLGRKTEDFKATEVPLEAERPDPPRLPGEVEVGGRRLLRRHRPRLDRRRTPPDRPRPPGLQARRLARSQRAVVANWNARCAQRRGTAVSARPGQAVAVAETAGGAGDAEGPGRGASHRRGELRVGRDEDSSNVTVPRSGRSRAFVEVTRRAMGAVQLNEARTRDSPDTPRNLRNSSAKPSRPAASRTAHEFARDRSPLREGAADAPSPATRSRWSSLPARRGRRSRRS